MQEALARLEAAEAELDGLREPVAWMPLPPYTTPPVTQDPQVEAMHEALAALVSNNEHAESGGMVSYQKGLQTWRLWPGCGSCFGSRVLLITIGRPVAAPRDMLTDEVMDAAFTTHGTEDSFTACHAFGIGFRAAQKRSWR